MARDRAIYHGEWFGSGDVKKCRRKARIYNTAVYKNE
jgi:hypothetical protein